MMMYKLLPVLHPSLTSLVAWLHIYRLPHDDANVVCLHDSSKNIIRLGIPGKLHIKLYKTINNYLRIKIKLRSFKSSEPINEEKDEP